MLASSAPDGLEEPGLSVYVCKDMQEVLNQVQT